MKQPKTYSLTAKANYNADVSQ